jgi:hypothetical protein
MFSTVLPVGVVALLLSMTCWSVGASLVSSKSPLVGMLCGWCCFLLLCAVPWMAGLPANAMQPCLWVFFAAGIVAMIRGRYWRELICGVICTAVMTALLCAPFLRYPGLLAYGAHGLDIWGYVMTADWLQDHSIRSLPEIGVSPIRFNWTWHVLLTRERPLIYESLACLGSGTALIPTQAYLAYPIALLSSLAMAFSREPRVFQLRHWTLALLPALVLSFHPLIVLPWIAGFFGGSITALFTALAFAAAAVAGEGRARTEALALAALMMVFCAGLYSLKFLYVAVVLGGVPLLIPMVVMLLRHDFSRLRTARPSWLAAGTLAIIAILSVALFVLGWDQKVDTGDAQLPTMAAAHFLGIFGGPSPYLWLGYLGEALPDRTVAHNLVGLAAFFVMTTLFILATWARWKAARDLRIPLLVLLCLGLVTQTFDDQLIMAKALAIFGVALLIVLAAVSSELRHWALGFTALVICCLPCLRSASEMRDYLREPFIICTEENIADVRDGQDWRILGYLHFREDIDGIDWTRYPRTYNSVTQFLPPFLRERLAEKYRMNEP